MNLCSSNPQRVELTLGFNSIKFIHLFIQSDRVLQPNNLCCLFFRNLSAFEPIPLPCDLVQCPAEADMQCPEDSAVREIREINAVGLLVSNALGAATTTEVAATSTLGSTNSSSSIFSEVPDWQFAQCCLAKKCMCKTCTIPDCNNDDVVVELEPENMDTPGQCCGEYECKPEPNCTEAWDTDYYWLQSCRRCNCQKGERICQHSCEETEASANAICESKGLNMFYSSGETWVEGCYQCECVRGEPKCVIPFCSHVDCPSERQVTLKDDCCPVCWPRGEPMPHEKLRFDEHADDFGFAANHSSSTSSPETTPEPCESEFSKAVPVLHPSSNLTEYIYRIVIGMLIVIIILLGGYIRHLHAKQRSYRPVSNFDDKV